MPKPHRVASAVDKLLVAAFVSIVAFSHPPAQAQDPGGLAQRLAAPHRTAGNVARDGFRHPLEVLTFFGIRDDSTVVEILPGSAGYYMEILAPYLRDGGGYTAANRDGAAKVNANPKDTKDHPEGVRTLPPA